jgi:hypothetical protein
MGQSAVSRIWRAFGSKPHQTETFKLSPDPQFIDKVRDIVGLYLNPVERLELRLLVHALTTQVTSDQRRQSARSPSTVRSAFE